MLAVLAADERPQSQDQLTEPARELLDRMCLAVAEIDRCVIVVAQDRDRLVGQRDVGSQRTGRILGMRRGQVLPVDVDIVVAGVRELGDAAVHLPDRLILQSHQWGFEVVPAHLAVPHLA
jgi:hypothetical protein